MSNKLYLKNKKQVCDFNSEMQSSFETPLEKILEIFKFPKICSDIDLTNTSKNDQQNQSDEDEAIECDWHIVNDQNINF